MYSSPLFFHLPTPTGQYIITSAEAWDVKSNVNTVSDDYSDQNHTFSDRADEISVINKCDWDKNKRDGERNIDPDQIKQWDIGSEIIREQQQWPSLL